MKKILVTTTTTQQLSQQLCERKGKEANRQTATEEPSRNDSGLVVLKQRAKSAKQI